MSDEWVVWWTSGSEAIEHALYAATLDAITERIESARA